MNETRAELYTRVMEAQDLIAQALYKRGISNETIQDALDAADQRITPDERREDLYLSAITRFVEALNGDVEVRAVFGDEVVVVRRSVSKPAGGLEGRNHSRPRR